MHLKWNLPKSSLDDSFRNYENYSSLTELSVLAMLDTNFMVEIEMEDFNKYRTVEDLVHLVTRSETINSGMSLFKFCNVGITGLAAAVPQRVINNYEYDLYFSKEDIKEIVDKIGVKERRFADINTCSSDLCFAAAEKLIKDMNINREEIDLLVFISQTPDYRMPATSVLLQERLGLPTSTIAFDINLGCSAFLFGLTVVYSMITAGIARKALLLDGETRSKVYSQKDRKTGFLFGDAGVAALIEPDVKIWLRLVLT